MFFDCFDCCLGIYACTIFEGRSSNESNSDLFPFPGHDQEPKSPIYILEIMIKFPHIGAGPSQIQQILIDNAAAIHDPLYSTLDEQELLQEWTVVSGILS